MTALPRSAAAPRTAARDESDRRAIALWLFVMAAMVFVMVVIGALTRLTESGLSIVEWKPITGWIPPLSEQAWQAEFAKYRQSPEYQIVNRGMSLDQFKGIFWLEFIHRLWGRLMGLAFALPLVWFAIRRRVPQGLMPHLLAMLVLGGAQGAIGWLMVQSGLVDRPSVSQYRLAAHLGMAILIYAYILWIALGLWQPRTRPAAPPFGTVRAFAGYVFLVMISGAFVAGLDAGLVHNTFPDMSGYLIPPGLYELTPAWINHFDNQTMVQFQHRWLAKLAVAAAIAVWFLVRRAPGIPAPARRAADLMLGMAVLQLCLGIATLLMHVPIAIATLHQAGALLLLTLALLLMHRLRRP